MASKVTDAFGRKGRRRFGCVLVIVLLCWLHLPYNLQHRYGDFVNFFQSADVSIGAAAAAAPATSPASKQPAGPPETAVFYHIYVADVEDTENARLQQSIVDIANEQLGEIARFSNQARNIQRLQPVYYTTIGSPRAAALLEEHFNKHDSFCYRRGAGYDSNMTRRNTHTTIGRLDCRPLGNWSQGFEEITMQHLYEYCQKNEDHNVVYLHNKGSFNPDVGKAAWRQFVTKAALSEQCALPYQVENETETCNVCGLLWTTLPHFHQPGNIWTAQCSYVNKLHPPNRFEAAVRDFLDKTLYPHVHNGMLTMKIASYDGECDVGTGRYAMEMWIGSHPDVQPCSLSKSGNLHEWIYAQLYTEADFSVMPVWKRFVYPNISQYHPKEFWEYFDSSLGERMKEYYALTGALLKWQALYPNNTNGVGLPAPDSWIWDFYQDGLVWKELIYGKNIVTINPNISVARLIAQLHENAQKNKQEQ